MGKRADYVILEEVAKEQGFDFNTLYDMFQIESSGRPGAVQGSYVGGFQFGPTAGEQYGLIGVDAEGNPFDKRKDLAESARAAIAMYEDNISGYSSTVEKSIKKHGLSDDLVAYMAHQQGRYGMQDIITGADSGNFKPPKEYEGSKDSYIKTLKENMISNVGAENKEKWKDLSVQDLAKNYINFWAGKKGAGKKGMFESKKEEAKTVRESLSSDEAFLIKEWTSEDNPFGFA